MNLEPDVEIYYPTPELEIARPRILLSFPGSFDEVIVGLRKRLRLSWKIETELRQSLRSNPSIAEPAKQFLLDDDGA